VNPKIRQLLVQQFGKVKAASHGEFRVPCPTCDEDDKDKMKRYIDLTLPYSYCYICNERLKLQDLLKFGKKGSLAEYRVRGADEHRGSLNDYPYARIQPYKVALTLSELPKDDPAIVFLRKDHLENLSYYDSLGIRYIPTGGGINLEFQEGDYLLNTSNTLYFPVDDGVGTRVGWQLRFIPDTFNGDRFASMKYMHLFPKGDYLFNYRKAKESEMVIVVEGVKKALKLSNWVATLGKGISTKQKELIQEWRHIVLILDGEDAAQDLALQMKREFTQNGRRCTNIDLREFGFESPDDTTTEQLQEIITTCLTRA